MSASARPVWPRSTRCSTAGCRSSASTPAGSPPAPPGATAGSCSAARTPACTRRSRAWGDGRRRLALPRDARRTRRGCAAELGPTWCAASARSGWPACPATREYDAEAADRERELRRLRRPGARCARTASRSRTTTARSGAGCSCPTTPATNPARRALDLARGCAGRAALHEHTPVPSGRAGAGRDRARHGLAPAWSSSRSTAGWMLLPALAGRVRTARLQMLATAPVRPGRLPCPVYGRWGYDYAQQDADGRLFVGGGRDRFEADEWTTDAEPTAPVQAYIETVADADGRRRRSASPTAGRASVGFTGDGRALCTAVDDGVVAVGGYNGTGNLVGPVAARAAVALPAGRRRPARAASPARTCARFRNCLLGGKLHASLVSLLPFCSAPPLLALAGARPRAAAVRRRRRRPRAGGDAGGVPVDRVEQRRRVHAVDAADPHRAARSPSRPTRPRTGRGSSTTSRATARDSSRRWPSRSPSSSATGRQGEVDRRCVQQRDRADAEERSTSTSTRCRSRRRARRSSTSPAATTTSRRRSSRSRTASTRRRRSIADLKGAKLAAQKGTTSFDAINNVIKPGPTPAEFPTNDLAVQALKNGQVDGSSSTCRPAFYVTSAQVPGREDRRPAARSPASPSSSASCWRRAAR